jgi:hypothetical protein
VDPDAAAAEPGPAEGRAAGVWHLLTGRPLRFREAEKEQITPVEDLSALSLDAPTSVACGPEAILLVLATAGVAAVPKVLPITVAIVVLLAILVFSYLRVIDAYPGGGGAYAVSKANLGRGRSGSHRQGSPALQGAPSETGQTDRGPPGQHPGDPC